MCMYHTIDSQNETTKNKFQVYIFIAETKVRTYDFVVVVCSLCVSLAVSQSVTLNAIAIFGETERKIESIYLHVTQTSRSVSQRRVDKSERTVHRLPFEMFVSLSMLLLLDDVHRAVYVAGCCCYSI